MLLYTLTFFIHSILVATSAVEEANNTLVGSVAAKVTCPSDPFSVLRAHATSKPSDPICCLVPPPSEDLTSTDEFLSFEEWKSKQRELELHSSQIQSPNQTGQNDSSGPKASDDRVSPTTLPPNDPETMLDTTPTQLPHFRVPLTDRFNYASLDCSARIRSSHSSARSPSSLLSSKKDKYMLSPCSDQPNYVVVELCDDIRIDTVQLANFEYFSGVFRDFKVSVAHTYTSDDQTWVEAGSYRAKNIRGVQSFHPLVDLRPFYRYVRVDFLSHYGNEYYCPVSLLRVYGLTQLEEWKWELWQSTSEPAMSHTGSILNSIATQSAESNASILNIPELSTSNPPNDASNKEDTLFSVASSDSLTDIDITDKHSPTHLPPVSSASIPNTVAVIPSSEPLPIVSFDPSASQSLLPAQATNASTSLASPVGSSIPMSAHSSSGDSIFRTIMNRLNMLEANTTLYNQYVQEQTLRLRDALRKLEEDVGRLEGLNKNQQQMFLRTVQEFDRHRHQIERERSALLERINQLADEIILEKRLGIAQLCLLLTVLIFMTLTRGSRSNISTLFSGAVHHRRTSSWSLGNFARSRSKTPVPHVAQKKGHTRSHSTTLTPASKPTPRSPRKDTHATSTPQSNSKGVFKDERPTYRLHRSNSNTTPVVSPSSGKRLAQTAHLHEISVFKRHELNIPESGRTSASINIKTLRSKKNSAEFYDRYTSDPNNQSKADKASDSWIDTEPGSGTSDNDPESLF